MIIDNDIQQLKINVHKLFVRDRRWRDEVCQLLRTLYDQRPNLNYFYLTPGDAFYTHNIETGIRLHQIQDGLISPYFISAFTESIQNLGALSLMIFGNTNTSTHRRLKYIESSIILKNTTIDLLDIVALRYEVTEDEMLFEIIAQEENDMQEFTYFALTSDGTRRVITKKIYDNGTDKEDPIDNKQQRFFTITCRLIREINTRYTDAYLDRSVSLNF